MNAAQKTAVSCTAAVFTVSGNSEWATFRETAKPVMTAADGACYDLAEAVDTSLNALDL